MYNMRQEGKRHSMTRNKAKSTIEKQGQTVKQASKEENRKQEVQLYKHVYCN